MPYNEKMADRIRELLALSAKEVQEKKMFSGLCFMVDDKMCVAVRPDSIMVRIDPENTEKELEKEGTTPMVHSGKIMMGFLFVDNEVLKTKKQLDYWVNQALAFNEFAKSSKKGKKAGATARGIRIAPSAKKK
jgi:TfoX/Sxy family transcriptional regulator of competence genes